MSLILDTGALVAPDKGDRRIAVLIDEASKLDEAVVSAVATYGDGAPPRSAPTHSAPTHVTDALANWQ